MTPIQEITGYTEEARKEIKAGYISAITGTVELSRISQYVAYTTGSAFIDIYTHLTDTMEFADKTYSPEVIDAVILAAVHDWIDDVASVIARGHRNKRGEIR